MLGGVLTPPGDPVQQPAGHLVVDGALGQQVLSAVDLRCLAQDRGAALGDEQVCRRAQRRVRRDAGVAVGAAALQAQDQFRGGHRLPLDVHLLQQGLYPLDTRAHRGRRTARILDGHAGDRRGGGQVQLGDLVDLTAEPDDDDPPEVRMVGITGQGATEQLEPFAVGGEATAGLVGDGHDTVDAGVRGEHARRPHPFRHQLRHRGGAVDGGDDADVVACRDTAVGTDDALERLRLDRVGRRNASGRDPRVAGIGEADVMDMDMVAGRDRGGRVTDHLPVFQHRRALGDRDRGDFVSGRHRLAHDDASDRAVPGARVVERQLGPRLQTVERHRHRIVRAEPEQSLACRHCILLRQQSITSTGSARNRLLTTILEYGSSRCSGGPRRLADMAEDHR